MIDDTTTRIIEKLNDETNPLSRFELIKEELKRILLGKKFMEINEIDGENIISVTTKSSKSLDPRRIKIIAINIDVKNTSQKEIKFKVKGENIKGKNIARNCITAQVLRKLQELKENDVKGDFRLLFYCWLPSFSKLEKILGDLLDTKAPIWIIEPTSFLLCPVEKGFGRLRVTLKPPASLKSQLNEIFQEFKNKMDQIYKPSHGIYPTKGIPQLVNAFLPGAPIVKIFGTDFENTLDKSSIIFPIDYNMLPFDGDFLDNMVANIKNIVNEINEKIEFHHESEFHFPGAKSSINNDLFQEMNEAHRRVFAKEPYIEWHIHESIASVLHDISSDYHFVIYGPGDPFLVGEKQESIPVNHADAFQELLDIII